MQDLQLIGVHEDGEHLLLSGADDARFRLPVDEALRAALRRDRPHLGQQQIEADGGLRPRDVQALIRAGASSDEAASRAGWTVEKVHRYEGPILAEREHVAGLAQKARLRNRHGDSSGGAPTLSARVSERLKSRDVEVTETSWDSWRSEGGPWTVVLTFAAGGRQRQASWSFDLADRTVSAEDDEARWLSEEVQTAKGPIPAPLHRPSPGRDTTVYDVEAEGGLHPAAREEHQEDPLDLMSAMRKRSTARGRRRPGGNGATSKTGAARPGSPRTSPAKTAPGVPDDDRQPPDQAPASRDLDHGSETTSSPADPGTSPDRSRAVAEEAGDDRPEPGAVQPALAHLDEALALSESSPGGGRPEAPPAGETSDESPGSSDNDDQTPESAERPPKRGPARPKKRSSHESARKAGRPSVPAWDEIMFGSRPGADRSSR
jgi:Protein of unknown function (DUF3071)